VRFLYQFRTSDNVVHAGVVNAANKDAAFAVLKKQGVRPSRLVEAPGVLNKLFGKGKRWIAIGVLCALCLVLCALTLYITHEAQSTMHKAQSTMHVFDDCSRRQPIGDAAVIEKGVRTGWADVFELEGERFLASFAIPGVAPAVRTTTEAALLKALEPHPSSPVPHPSSLSIEARQIKSMVEGMKEELRRFCANGGTPVAYGRRLVERQEQEIGYYNRVKGELEKAVKSGMDEAALEALWEERNASLRAIGVRLVPMPE